MLLHLTCFTMQWCWWTLFPRLIIFLKTAFPKCVKTICIDHCLMKHSQCSNWFISKNPSKTFCNRLLKYCKFWSCASTVTDSLWYQVKKIVAAHIHAHCNGCTQDHLVHLRCINNCRWEWHITEKALVTHSREIQTSTNTSANTKYKFASVTNQNPLMGVTRKRN